MIRAAKVRSITVFEFLSTVKRKGYLIATFGMPLFLLLYGLILAIPGFYEARRRVEVKIYGVVDRADLLHLRGDVAGAAVEIPAEIRAALEAAGRREVLDQALSWSGRFVFRPVETARGARTALEAKRIEGYFVLDADFLASGRVDAFFREAPALASKEVRGPFKSLILDHLLRGRVPPEISARAREPVTDWREWTLTRAGELRRRTAWAVLASIVIPLVFAMLLMMSLLMSSGYLIQATAVEKENRVVEVLLSSARPEEILTGKLLGLGAAGLLQVCVWFAVVIAGGLAFAGALAALGVGIPWGAIGASLLFFLAGYLFLGSLMLGTGSLGSNIRESQQYSVIWTMMTVLPLIFLKLLIDEPHGTVARILTWIPFTAPLTVVLRMTLDPGGIAWWELAGSLGLLALCTWATIGVAARLFRVGLLLTGSRPRLREILRQARLT